MKKLGKALGNSENVRRLLCALVAAYIRLVRFSGRWDAVNAGLANKMWDERKPFILAFWHGRLLMMPYAWRHLHPIHMLISQHRDGRLIAETVAHFGINSISGSTSRGAAAALRAMLKALKRGDCVGITPDGPRGPCMRASAGAVNIAKLAGVPILPATFSASNARPLSSWDRFLVPLPFARGIFIWGEPVEVPSHADAEMLENCRRLLEDRLNAISAEADRRMGIAPVEPAPQ